MKPVIIDVREPSEFSTGHVEGAINISLTELASGSEKLIDIPEGAEIVLYCLSGVRADTSLHYLHKLGYTNLTNGINQATVRAKYSL